MKLHDLLEGRVATWSNLISVMRIFVAPWIAVALYYEAKTGETYYTGVAICMYIIVALSDVLDGVLARMLRQVSRLGQFLDPLADKFVILTVAVALYFFRDFPLWLIIVIAIRDVLHVVAGMYLFYIYDIQVRATFAGKCMVLGMGLCGLIYILNPPYTICGYTLKQIFIVLVVLLIVVSSVVNWNTYSRLYFTGKR